MKNLTAILFLSVCIQVVCGEAGGATEKDSKKVAQAPVVREERDVLGWKVHVNKVLLDSDRVATERALELLKKQLEEVHRVVPKTAVVELQKVPLYFSPEYPGVQPRAEYHGHVGWLRSVGRDPAMAKCVEFTNVRIFEKETKRMPNFALHELAHAYHDRVVPGAYKNPEIKAAYDRAKADGKYSRVERRHGGGRPNSFEQAYAMSNPMEYFAEATEGYFASNDFFPFIREELKQHDPEMYLVLEKLWGAGGETAPDASSQRTTPQP